MYKGMYLGNVAKEPETRTLGDGKTTVCNFTLAINKYRNGEKKTDFVRVTAWNKLAENCRQYVHTGDKVCVIASDERVTAYIGNDGNPHGQIEITAENIEFCTSKQERAEAPAPEKTYTEIEDEQLPF